MKQTSVFILLLFLTLNTTSQNPYRSPLDIPIVLSANFAELRPNHFHSGIDLKTQGVVNKPVYSIADGHVSRISVSPSGYGLALYVNHPETGHTSVYGHLNKYAPKIAEYIKDKQYEKESYRIDIKLDSNEIPVKKGELIAYSGNTGSSFGPHVHFEIRDTQTQNALDPLIYYKSQIEDTRPPQLRGIGIYPMTGEGVVNNSSDPYRKAISTKKNGDYISLDGIHAWGKIGIGVYTNDRMTGTHNIYGVKTVRLFCDDTEIFSSDITSVDFNTTRMINSMIDFEYWLTHKDFYQKSFVEPGNKLPIYKSENDGYIDINEERMYTFRYELTDLYGNSTIYSFSIEGKKQDIPPHRKCTQMMVWNQNNRYISEDFNLTIPSGYLYKDLCFILKKRPSQKHLSDIYQVNDKAVPLNDFCDMTIKMTKDSLVNKSQYGLVLIKGDKESWVGGIYEDGYIQAGIRQLGGDYAVSTDTKAPTITPVKPTGWVNQKAIKIRLTDNKSGIASYKGTINGEFVLFEHDTKSTVYTYNFDPKRLKKGQIQKLKFTATDACGNKATYEYSFKY